MWGSWRGLLVLAPLAAASLVLATAPAGASDKPPKNLFVDRMLFRFEFDNDSYIGSDDTFTAGWSFQVHSRLMDDWNKGFRWMGHVPGLGDDGKGSRIVRWAAGLSQIIVTPTDISIATPQPNDAPWAGTLAGTLAWSAYDNKRLAALQAYLGCMGPCSYAEQVQKFVHEDLGFGDPPKGWDNQLANQVLANVNYEWRHKVYVSKPDAYAFGRFAHDLAGGVQAGAGNLDTFVRVDLQMRFGWGMPMGFTKVPDPPGIGITLDPIYFDPSQPPPATNRWSVSFNVVARYAYVERLAFAEGGATANGGYHPPLQFPSTTQLIVGIHAVRAPFGIHVSYFRYFDTATELQGTLDWVNISLEYRF